MLSFQKVARDVYQLTLDGLIDKSDMLLLERKLSALLTDDRKIGLVVNMLGWSDLTADALSDDLQFETGLLLQVSKVDRIAVVTNLQVVSGVTRWIDKMLPQVSLKNFGPDELHEAEKFASDLPGRKIAGKGVTLLSDGSNGVLAFEVDGPMTDDDLQIFLRPLESLLSGNERFSLLIQFNSFDGIDHSILTSGSLFGSKPDVMRHLERYAVVGAPTWMSASASALATLMPFEFRFFELQQSSEARSWVGLL